MAVINLKYSYLPLNQLSNLYILLSILKKGIGVVKIINIEVVRSKEKRVNESTHVCEIVMSGKVINTRVFATPVENLNLVTPELHLWYSKVSAKTSLLTNLNIPTDIENVMYNNNICRKSLDVKRNIVIDVVKVNETIVYVYNLLENDKRGPITMYDMISEALCKAAITPTRKKLWNNW